MQPERKVCKAPEYNLPRSEKVFNGCLSFRLFDVDNQLPGEAGLAYEWVVGIYYCTASLGLPFQEVTLLGRHNKLLYPEENGQNAEKSRNPCPMEK